MSPCPYLDTLPLAHCITKGCSLPSSPVWKICFGWEEPVTLFCSCWESGGELHQQGQRWAQCWAAHSQSSALGWDNAILRAPWSGVLPVGCCRVMTWQPVLDPPGWLQVPKPSPGRDVLEAWAQPGDEIQLAQGGTVCGFSLSAFTAPLLWEGEHVCWWQADKWISAYVQSAVPGEGNKDLSSPRCFRQCFRPQPELQLRTFIDGFSRLLLAAQWANNNILNEQAEIWQGRSPQAAIMWLSGLKEGKEQPTTNLDVWWLI